MGTQQRRTRKTIPSNYNAIFQDEHWIDDRIKLLGNNKAFISTNLPTCSIRRISKSVIDNVRK